MFGATVVQMTSMARLTEILHNETVNVEKTDQNQINKKDVETITSDGVCLHINGIDDLLISHNRDIVLDSHNFDKYRL